jgi:hypothetical protein
LSCHYRYFTPGAKVAEAPQNASRLWKKKPSRFLLSEAGRKK